MPASVEENQARNCDRKYTKGPNMLSEAPKRTKMKMKAAKFMKFLLNFLQIKSKRKHGDKEKLCLSSHIPISHTNVASDQPLKLAGNTPSSDQIDKGLSLSWSYLVHDTFVSNLEECAECADCDDDSGATFNNESYFEDDYWQDFHEQDIPMKSPLLFGNESLRRLFEPERTPCGEFKRNISHTLRRRHASLPNFAMKESSVLKMFSSGEETGCCEASEEILDYNQLMFRHSQFGLNIAFDNLLDETSVWNGTICSNVNQTQLLPVEETNTEHSLECSTDQILKFREQESKDDSDKTFLCSPTPSANFENFDDLFETTVESSVQVIEVFFSEDQASDKSGYMPSADSSYDVNLVCKPQLYFGSHEMDRFVPSQQQIEPTSSTAEQISDFPHSSITKKSSDYSSDNAYLAAVTPCLAQTTLYSMCVQKPGLDSYTEDGNQDLNKIGAEDTKTHNPPIKLPVGASTESAKLHMITTPSTSSPVHFVNATSHIRKVLTSIPSFISPIGQNSEILKSKQRTKNCVSSLKQNRHNQRGFLMNLSLCPKSDLVSSSEVRFTEPCGEDHLNTEHCSGHQVNEHCSEGHQVTEHCSEGHQVTEHCSEGHQVTEHCSEGHQVTEHCSEGHQVTEHCSEGHQVTEHCSEGHQVTEHCSEGHQVTEHCSEGHQVTEHCSEGHQVTEHCSEGHQVTEHCSEGHMIAEYCSEDHQPTKPTKTCNESDHLLARAADFILNRIRLKKELKPHINISELAEYLSSYYMAEISKLSNKIVQTVADYKKIMQESMDLFHLDRLTQENSFNELLTAILVNRPTIVSKCEHFIFENLHYFVNRQEYIEAAPELICMLLCNTRITRLDPHFKRSEFEVKKYINNYLEAHQTNFERYSRMKRMFSIVFDQTAAIQLGENAENVSSSVFEALSNAVSETKMQTVKLASAEYMKRISACNISGRSNWTSTDRGKSTSRILFSGAKRSQSYLEGESIFSLKQKPQRQNDWRRMGPVISTMV